MRFLLCCPFLNVDQISIQNVIFFPYQSVLSQADKNWSVHSMALLLRTYWESESPRRMERTMAQLEVLPFDTIIFYIP